MVLVCCKGVVFEDYWAEKGIGSGEVEAGYRGEKMTGDELFNHAVLVEAAQGFEVGGLIRVDFVERVGVKVFDFHCVGTRHVRYLDDEQGFAYVVSTEGCCVGE